MPKAKRRVKRRAAPSGSTLVYALEAADANHSYVGVTNNFARRLRQHNGLKGGGARYTKRKVVNVDRPNWSPIFKVIGLPSRRQALQLEKLFHKGFRGRRLVHPPSKPANPFGTSAAARRAWHLYWALKKERFSQQKTVVTKKLSLVIEWSRADFYGVAKKLREWGPATIKHVLIS